MATKIFSVDIEGKLSYQSDMQYFNQSYLGYRVCMHDSYIRQLEKLEELNQFCFLYEPLNIPRVNIRESFYMLFRSWGIDTDDIFIHIYYSYDIAGFVEMIKAHFNSEALIIYQAILQKDSRILFHYVVTHNASVTRKFAIDRAIFYVI